MGRIGNNPPLCFSERALDASDRRSGHVLESCDTLGAADGGPLVKHKVQEGENL